MILLTIILFILILGLLIFVHELGHFITAKRSGMKVEEFGFGFPPRILGLQRLKSKDGKSKKRWSVTFGGRAETDSDHTVYSINWIPLGGFVKILGENGDSSEEGSFVSKSAFRRFLVLIAGVTMNVILAWVLISITLTIGLPTLINQGETFPAGARTTEPHIAIVYVAPGSPAEAAGIRSGDVLDSIDKNVFQDVPAVQDFTSLRAGQALNFEFTRGSEVFDKTIIPRTNPPEGEGPLGVVLGTVVNVSYPWYRAFYEGLSSTFWLGVQILMAFGSVIKSAFSGKSLIGSLTGPVGIAILTRDAARLGFVYVLNFTAVLSLNLAIINALPFPALDGGRVLFLAIEKIRRKKMNLKIEQLVNTAGFLLLILLMVWVTFSDFSRFSPQLSSLWQRIGSLFGG